jgi:hypothetical protein
MSTAKMNNLDLKSPAYVLTISRLQQFSQKFDVCKEQCMTAAKLCETFNGYRNRMLQLLLEPFKYAGGNGDVNADILDLGLDGAFLFSVSTKFGGELVVPTMRLERSAAGNYQRPERGIAPYCCWALDRSHLPGFAMTTIDEHTNLMQYYQRGSAPNKKAEYNCLCTESGMYELEQGGSLPDYKSLLSTAIYRFVDAPLNPDGKSKREPMGTLGITCSHSSAFTERHGVWLIACALEFSRLRMSYDYRRSAIESERTGDSVGIKELGQDVVYTFGYSQQREFAQSARKLLEEIGKRESAIDTSLQQGIVRLSEKSILEKQKLLAPTEANAILSVAIKGFKSMCPQEFKEFVEEDRNCAQAVVYVTNVKIEVNVSQSVSKRRLTLAGRCFSIVLGVTTGFVVGSLAGNEVYGTVSAIGTGLVANVMFELWKRCFVKDHS